MSVTVKQMSQWIPVVTKNLDGNQDDTNFPTLFFYKNQILFDQARCFRRSNECIYTVVLSSPHYWIIHLRLLSRQCNCGENPNISYRQGNLANHLALNLTENVIPETCCTQVVAHESPWDIFAHPQKWLILAKMAEFLGISYLG